MTSLWGLLNSNDSWLPLYLSSCIWLPAWVYSKQTGIDFSRWHKLHAFHHVVVLCLAFGSLYYNDDSILNERLPILWDASYFAIDIIDCLWEKKLTYTIHGIFSLVLSITNYTYPIFRELRMNSKADFIETSTLILYKARQTRDPKWFALFAFVFTCCRIIWIPIIMKQVYQAGLPLISFSFSALIGFYALNWYWYLKIIHIIIKGPREDTKKPTKTD